MARKIPTAPEKPGNGRVPAQEAAPAPAEPGEPKEPERLKLTTLARLEPGRPALEIDGRVFSFQNPLALGALTRNRLSGLYERLSELSRDGGITTPEKEAENLDTLAEIAAIALPDIPGGAEALRGLGDVQLDAIAGAFFVEAAPAMPTTALARLFGVSPSGANSSQGSRASTARARKRGS